MENKVVEISVIVCTYNRADRVHLCLDSIEQSIQKAGNVNAEIIVVNNRSNDNTHDVLEAWVKNCSVPTYNLTEETPGVQATRNCGLRKSQGKIIVFIDDDCVLETDYIPNLLKHYEGDEEPVMRFASVRLGHEEDWPMTVKDHPHKQRWQKSDMTTPHFQPGDIIGCSMVITREIFEDVGFFDEIFSTKDVPGGNDTEFGLRVYLDDFAVEYCPDMVLTHYHGRREEKEVRKLIQKYCIGCGAAYAKFLWRHPRIVARFSNQERPPRDNVVPYQNDERVQKIGRIFREERMYIVYGALRYFRAKSKAILRGAS